MVLALKPGCSRSRIVIQGLVSETGDLFFTVVFFFLGVFQVKEGLRGGSVEGFCVGNQRLIKDHSYLPRHDSPEQHMLDS